MIIIVSMLALSMEYHFGYAGVIYAIGFAICAEVSYFMLVYWYMQKSEASQKKSYFDAVESYKARLDSDSVQEKKLEGKLTIVTKKQIELDKEVKKLRRLKTVNEETIENQVERLEKQRLVIKKYKDIEMEKNM